MRLAIIIALAASPFLLACSADVNTKTDAAADSETSDSDSGGCVLDEVTTAYDQDAGYPICPASKRVYAPCYASPFAGCEWSGFGLNWCCPK